MPSPSAVENLKTDPMDSMKQCLTCQEMEEMEGGEDYQIIIKEGDVPSQAQSHRDQEGRACRIA